MQTLDGGPGTTERHEPRGITLLPWLVGAAVVAVAALVVGVAVFLVIGGDGDTRDATGTGAPSALDGVGGLDPAPATESIRGSEGDATAAEADPSAAAAPDAGAPPDLLMGGAEDAIDDLRSTIGSEAQLVEIAVYDTYAITEYRSPRDPDNIDRVVWRNGAVEPPEPVGFTEDYTESLFRVGEVDLSQIPDLAREALDGFDLDGGVVTHVIVDRFFGLDDGGVAIRVYVTNPERGGGGYLLARGDGTVVELVD